MALNPSDFKMVMAFPSPGAVVGMGFTGHIVVIHDSTTRTDLHIGEAVCGMVHGLNPGDLKIDCFAEYLIVVIELVLKVLKDLPLEQAKLWTFYQHHSSVRNPKTRVYSARSSGFKRNYSCASL